MENQIINYAISLEAIRNRLTATKGKIEKTPELFSCDFVRGKEKSRLTTTKGKIEKNREVVFNG